MSDIPYHVAGGRFTSPSPTPATAFEFLRPSTPELGKPSGKGSRRRRLWEIPHKFHCPIVGTCFEVGELRNLMARVMHFPPATTDFVLHTTAVGSCETRSQLAELLHKHLEKRFQLIIRRFSSAKDSDALSMLWQEAVESGSDIPGALWASWTHPACDARLEQEIYGDIHMIQHQIGSGTRTDLKTLDKLKEENRQLRELFAKAREESELARNEKSRETQILSQRVAELRAEQVGRDACIATLTAQLDQLRTTLPDLKDRQNLARRASDAESRLEALTAHAANQQAEIQRLRQRLEIRERQNTEAAADEATEIDPTDLSGKCVLCVGGRSGAVDAYRQMVEVRGGRFLHHDGGLEESLHRIDGVLAAADLVICQAGCISHNAYWRVKEQCKRTGKPCLFVKGSGVSSFGRVVDAACSSVQQASHEQEQC